MRHASVRVAVGGEALATRLALEAPRITKRPHGAVAHGTGLVQIAAQGTCAGLAPEEERLIDDAQASDSARDAAGLEGYSSYVQLRTADEWQSRMLPGTLVSPQHAALVDVMVHETRLLTLPLARTESHAPLSAWIVQLLELERTEMVTVCAWIEWTGAGRFSLTLDVSLPEAVLGRPHAPDTTDRLLAVVTAINGLKHAQTAAPQPSDADLVYASLCRRELDEATRMPEAPQPRALHAHLLPFQKRSVAFLLEREAAPGDRKLLQGLGPWWMHVDAPTPLYFHVLTGVLTLSQDLASHDVCSAMLSEEMGLGKTVEILALLLERPAPHRNALEPFYDVANEVMVQPVGTTLIVAPETLRRQWLDELAAHAPSLRTYSFLGHKQAESDVRRAGHTSWTEWAKELDVVVISFETLAKELAVSTKAPVRSLRRPARYDRPRSQLVQLAFWRVVMDEVQLVGGNAAKTIAMVRREASIAVSGTPVRRLDDLRTCLWFMGLIRSASPTKEWQRILSPALAPHLARVLEWVGIRHTKADVAHEMVLPPQRRSLIPVEFTYTESAFYRDVYREALEALDITEDGAPRSETWQLDTGALRTQLLRLRQACTHPHVALRAGHMLGGESGATHGLVNLRSIDHVLTMMLDGARSELLTLRHNFVLKRIYRAAILLFAPVEDLRTAAVTTHPDEIALLESLATRDRLALAQHQLELLLPEVNDQLAKLEKEMDAAHAQGPLYQFTEAELAAEATYERAHKHSDTPWSAAPDAPYDKLRARQQHLGALRNRMRHWLQILHRIYQFSGHCFYQMGEAQQGSSEAPDAKAEGAVAVKKEETGLREKEDAAYAAAEATRQRLLADARESVEQCVRTMQRQRTTPLDELSPRITIHTLAGRSVLDMVQARLKTLRAHAALIVDWRNQIITRLSKPVNREVDKERENDDVYAENLDAQIEAETLLEMYRPLLAQRDELLSGRIALGATARPQLFVELDRALRVVKTRLFGATEEEEEESAQREAQKLQLTHFQRLDAARNQVALHGEPPLSELVARLRELRELSTRADESHLLASAHAILQEILRTQMQAVERLRKEQGAFQACFNARSLYFKQMQELSDQVQDPEMPDGAVPSLLAALAQERAWRQRIGAVEGRIRYLVHLEQIQGGSADDEARRCFICTNLIDTGILTNACGHLCCQSCFYAWMKQGKRTCPMCKTKLALNDVHRVVYRSSVPQGESEGGHAPSASQAYRVLPDTLRSAIERTASEGRYGSKLDLLAKHLVHLHRTTGEKSLVFSSFSRGLDLVAESLRANGLQYARLEGGGSKKVGATVETFQHSPHINILLLHSEVQSAGLNLLAATHLFLLEPLMNHALELQAIGRVHRIGQTRATNVYCYMVNDTVEQRIVALATSRAQCLYVARDADANAADAMDSAALQAQHLEHVDGDVSREARRGDLMGSTDDLLACLFQEHIPGDPYAENEAMGIDEMRARRIATLQPTD